MESAYVDRGWGKSRVKFAEWFCVKIMQYCTQFRLSFEVARYRRPLQVMLVMLGMPVMWAVDGDAKALAKRICFFSGVPSKPR